MKTHLDCIPCFLKQTIESARITGADEKLQKKIIDEVCKIIPDFSFEASPPQMAVKIHKIIRELTSNKDPYKKIKQDSQKLALGMYPYLKEQVTKADDALSSAVKIAAIGNVIDLAVNDVATINRKLEDISNHEFAIFDYGQFTNALNNAKTILYLGDNAGEIVLDKLFIETINHNNLYFAVRGAPVINDATIEDAVEDNLDAFCTIISNGTDAPGTLLNQCSEEFMNIYNQADVIIAKGQANFETLNQVDRNIYFLTQIKCSTIAQRYGYCVGDWLMTTMNKLQAYDEVLL
ncbi:MAG: DUF89 family protein [Clostridiales bacterium]|nr:DUF89 family protein [Clostridiales bacterium]